MQSSSPFWKWLYNWVDSVIYNLKIQCRNEDGWNHRSFQIILFPHLFKLGFEQKETHSRSQWATSRGCICWFLCPFVFTSWCVVTVKGLDEEYWVFLLQGTIYWYTTARRRSHSHRNNRRNKHADWQWERVWRWSWKLKKVALYVIDKYGSRGDE